MIALIVLLSLLLCVGWMLLLRHRKALQAANIRLLQQDQRESSLLFQLSELNEKYHVMEDKLQKTQYELYKEKHKTNSKLK
ncbi:hypothetical protein CLV51_104242 [Chitinophaga niastensis]|uniref:Uncharacterized protein n=1 Tax=Chitinophaga niastensis TaxID=536980 RepID=A0A2P8HH48_CHINA|nr:hypothetical protein [Chitinophaga niastensis]PSL45537.1 hypothetical protein CLV51_104242 [Chitinophaga niastensis]